MMDTQRITRRIAELLQLKSLDLVVRITAEALLTEMWDNPNLQIEKMLKSWGHNFAPGCVVCDTVTMLVADDADVRVIDGVIVTTYRA